LSDGAWAATRIGNEATLPPVPTSAHYSSVVNVRPGNGEVVSNNPPLFSWFYNTNHLVGGDMNPNGWTDTVPFWTNSFIFQVATNATFTGNLQVNTNTFHNFYNFIGPLDTSASRHFWWRIIYQRRNIPYWENRYTFTVAPDATSWDRSMFANPNYLATNGVHPIFCFREGEQASIYAWMQTQPDYAAIVSRANAATNASYFKNHSEWPVNTRPNPNSTTMNPPDAFNRMIDLGCVLNLWALSEDNRWKNSSMTGWLVTNLQHYANWFRSPSNNWSTADSGSVSMPPDAPLLLAASYDWMYQYLGNNVATFNGQVRTNLLLAINQCLKIQTWANCFYTDTNTGGYSSFAPGRYPYPTSSGSVPAHSIMKLPSSHPNVTLHTFLPLCLVAQQDSPDGAFAFDWMVNFMLARSSGYGGFAAFHAGPYGYGYANLAKIYGGGVIAALMHIDVSYPQLQIYRNDFCTGFPGWFTRMVPYNMRRFHGPYGDGGPYTENGHAGSMGFKQMGWDLAAVTRSGAALQLYNLNAEFAEPGGPHWSELPLRWHYTNQPALITNSTSAVFPADGYVIASSKSSSEFDCYTNGVGFSTRARPRGSLLGHDVLTDGSMDIWAYGTQLTDGGGANCCGEDYSYQPESAPGTMFFNGQGQFGPGYLSSPRIPVQAFISAFTNSGTDFVYTCTDVTGLFNNGWNPQSNVVTKAKQHILFVRSKYFVLFTEFGAKTPTAFQWRWHIPWVWRWPGSGSALAREIEVNAGQFGSNSFVLKTNGFTYDAGNFALTSFRNPPRLPVHVVFANATNQYGVYVATGTGNLALNAAGVNGTKNTNSTLNPFRAGGTVFSAGGVVDRAVGLWVTNRAGGATNWNLMTVIVPQQPGVAAPVIERLDDYTVVVTYDGVTETNTFGTSYTNATYRVDMQRGQPPRMVGGVGGAPRVVGEVGNWSVNRN
jgi:hypothetical protein